MIHHELQKMPITYINTAAAYVMYGRGSLQNTIALFAFYQCRI